MDKHLDVVALEALQRLYPDSFLVAAIEGIAKLYDPLMLLCEQLVSLIIAHDIDIRPTIDVDTGLHLYLIDALVQLLSQPERGFGCPSAAVDAHIAAFGDEAVFTIQTNSQQQKERECKDKSNLKAPHTLISLAAVLI